MSNPHRISPRRGFQELSRALSAVHAELQQIAQETSAISGLDAPTGQYLSDIREVSAARALTVYRARRQRDAAFGGDADLFSEPAWDILLDLLHAEAQGSRISITSASVAAHVPPTTALRTLAILEERGLVGRSHDPSDRRRSHLNLTEKGRTAMHAALAWKDQIPSIRG